jgi:hypothetical protein
MAEATALVSKNDVSHARVELDRMKRSLQSWLKYRKLNDAVAAGQAPTKKPLSYARLVVSQSRDWDAEQRLAKQLHVLLAESFPDAQLPDPNVTVNPQVAVQLAQIAINGPGPTLNSPQAQGFVWMWPVLIVGGLLLAVTTAIKTAADVSKEKERIACIQAGACTDYGFWLKAGGIAALAWVAWQMGVGEKIKRAVKGKGG